MIALVQSKSTLYKKIKTWSWMRENNSGWQKTHKENVLFFTPTHWHEWMEGVIVVRYILFLIDMKMRLNCKNSFTICFSFIAKYFMLCWMMQSFFRMIRLRHPQIRTSQREKNGVFQERCEFRENMNSEIPISFYRFSHS